MPLPHQRTPLASPTYAPWVPTQSIPLIHFGTTFDALFKIDGFLNEIRKPGLCMLAQKLMEDRDRTG